MTATVTLDEGLGVLERMRDRWYETPKGPAVLRLRLLGFFAWSEIHGRWALTAAGHRFLESHGRGTKAPMLVVQPWPTKPQ